jgi:hypothetical protein
MVRSQVDAEWFKNQSVLLGNCWEWVGTKTSAGYGQLRVNGKVQYVHRISYELFVGIIPNDLEIDHLCRNRACMNPDHLEVVSHRDNVLRGDAPPARYACATMCINGHLFTDSNTYFGVGKNGNVYRKCRKCAAQRQRTYDNAKDVSGSTQGSKKHEKTIRVKGRPTDISGQGPGAGSRENTSLEDQKRLQRRQQIKAQGLKSDK